MHHLNLKVNPLVSVGPIQFGMKRSDVRRSLSVKYDEFQRSNANHGVGVKISASVPWPRYSSGASWDVENNRENYYRFYKENVEFTKKIE